MGNNYQLKRGILAEAKYRKWRSLSSKGLLKTLLTVFWIFVLQSTYAQSTTSVSATYTTGDIRTNIGSYSPSCIGILPITVPAGGTWQVQGFDVSYNMTAQNGGWVADQRSHIYCQNTNMAEVPVNGTGNSGGTLSYARTGVNIANGTYAGGSTLTFEMRAWRTWGSSIEPDCSRFMQRVNDNTWTITVHFVSIASLPCSTSVVIASNDADNSIAAGTSVTFTATPTNGGTSPTYQWQNNGQPINGETAATYTTTTLQNNDEITVVMTSNDACASANPTVTSNTVTMTVTTAPAPVTSNAALHFDGANDYVEIPNSTSLNNYATTGELTIEYWIKPVLGSVFNAVSKRPVSNDAGFTFECNAAGNVLYYIRSSTAWQSVGQALTANTWQHIAVTVKNNNSINLYVNGVLTQTSTFSGNLTTTSNAMRLMANAAALGTFGQGTMDDFRMWSVVRTAAEIQNNMSCELNGNETGLQAYYKFNNGIPNANNAGLTILNDATTNSNNGTLNNFALSGTTSNWVTKAIGLDVSIVSDAINNTTAAGTSVTFTATPSNNVTSPTYQWQNNGQPINGETAATYTTTTLADGDEITVVMTSSTCTTPVTSNTVTMTVTPVTFNAALHFDGANDYVEIPNSTSLNNYATTGELTIEYWIKPVLGSLFNAVSKRPVSNDAGFTFQCDAAGDVLYYIRSSTAWQSVGQALTANTWQHIAVTVKNNNSINLYVNGVLTQTSTFSGNLTTTSSAMRLMANAAALGTFGQGTMDDFRMWSVVRTAAEIQNNMSCELNGNEAGLQAYYKFNEGTPNANNAGLTILNDATTNSNNGTLNNFALSGTTSNWVTSITEVSIASDAINNTTAAGTSVTFTATPSNNVTSPTYQWQKNGQPINGETAATYTTTTLQNNDEITVVMTSSTCTTSVTSNTVTMTVTAVTVTSNAALHFDGANDYVDCGNRISNLGQLTLQTWIKPTSNIDYTPIITQEGVFELSVYNSGTVYIVIGSTALAYTNNTPFATANLGTWQHYTVVYDGTATGNENRLKLYINGVLQTLTFMAAMPITTGTTANIMKLGAYNTHPTRFTGTMDEVRLWNRALTQCEIQNNMNCELSSGQTGLLAYYNFNQTGTTLTDGSGNGNNATLTNFALTGTTSNWVSTGGVVSGTTCTVATPSVSIASNDADNSIAAGTSVTFTATPTNGGTAPTYQWQNNGQPINGETAATYTTTTLVDGDVITVVMTSNDACASPTTATSNSVTMTVTVTADPCVDNLTANSNCFSGVFTPNGLVNGAQSWSDGTVIFKWDGTQWIARQASLINDASYYFSNTTGSINSFPMTGWQSGNVSSCSTGAPLVLSGGTITPLVTVAASPSGAITAGTSVTFTSTPTNGGTAPTYQWQNNGQPINGETAATYTTTTLVDGDVITVVMTSNDACATDNPTATSNSVTMTVTPDPCAGISTRIYVTENGTGNGSSWANAMGDLQAAINNTCGVTEIWVAAGTYKPTAYPTGCVGCSTDRDFTFYVKDGVSIYGGFDGTETSLAERDIIANTTTLSGDIGTPNDNTDNCYHVVLAVGNAGVTIDGFTVTGGNADGTNNGYNGITINALIVYRFNGGGIYTINGTNTITNNTVSDNTTINNGGGISVNFGTNTLSNNTVSGNSGVSGGGIATFDGTNDFINNKIFGNTASEGGGIATGFSTTTFTNNTVYNNVATNSGGGISVTLSTTTFTNNTVYNNSANIIGGGLYKYEGTCTLTNSIFWENKRAGSSTLGSADINLTTLITISHCLTQQNSFFTGTGVINNQNPLFTDAANGDFTLQINSPCIETGSDAAWTATGLTTDIAGNTRPIGIVDMGAFESACIPVTPSVSVLSNDTDNNIVAGTSVTFTATPTNGGTTPTYQWKNNGQPINGETAAIYTTTTLQDDDQITVVMTSSEPCASNTATSNIITMAVCAPVTPSVSVLSNDTDNSIITGTSVTFTATPTNGGTAPTYQWQNNGQPINGETAATYTTTTLVDGDVITVEMTSTDACAAANPTATSNGVTMTVTTDPCVGTSNRIYVTENGTGNGSSWANATNDLQAAINNTCGITEIWVAAGTYKPAAYPTSCVGCSTDRDFTFYIKDGVSIYGGFDGTEASLAERNISANTTTLSGDIGTLNDNTDNCYHVVLAVGSVGVTIDGFTVTGGNADASSAASPINVNFNAILRNLGGGILLNMGTNTINNNTIVANNTTARGGGIYVNEGTNTFTNNVISNNTAQGTAGGGGIYTSNGTNTLINNVVSSNTSGLGSIYTNQGTNTLINNTISDNAATYFSGGIVTLSSNNTLSNNIFWGNKIGTDATVAGVDYYAAGVNNNTLTNNLLQLVGSNYTASGTGNYGIGSASSGNIFAQNPLFVDAANGDFSLQAGSPAIDAGLNAANNEPADILGNFRIHNSIIDMGAYEYGSLPLPVEFIYFTGEATENGNLLTWATASEENNAGFEVQKSTDARTFEKIGFVVGNGTTYEQQTYEFLDNNTNKGTTYYRLKQMDFDGKFDYSNIVSIHNENENAIAEMLLYPNPVKDFLTIENGEGTAIIYNALGQPLQQFNITDTKYLLNTNELPQGIYTLQVRRADGTAVVKQFVK